MTPDSLEIDRHFDGVGRVKLRIGSPNPVLRRKYNRMLDSLRDDGRTDVIRAIKLRQLKFAEVYEAWQRNALASLPIGNTAPLLSGALQRWLDGLVVGEQRGADCSAKHFTSLEQSKRYLDKAAPKARIADLPDVLERMRGTLGAKHPTSFNHVRAAVLTFIRMTMKRSHPLWLQVAAVERRKIRERDRRQGIALNVAQMEEFFPDRANSELDAIAWSMATTGMHEKEYWDTWRIMADRVRIGGKKRPHRMRDVPLVIAPRVPQMHPRTFADKLRDRTNRFIQPYDLRRTYANWLEAASITRARRKMYMGHSAGDVTGLYERHEVDAFLREDAQKLRKFLGLPPTISPTLALHKEREA